MLSSEMMAQGVLLMPSHLQQQMVMSLLRRPTTVYPCKPLSSQGKSEISWAPETLLSSASSTGEGNGTPLQYSCLENPMNGGAWKAAVHGVSEGQLFTFLHWRRKWQPSVLAWRILGMGEPGGLPSMESHRVGHN